MLTFEEQLREWQFFYATVATASATLTGQLWELSRTLQPRDRDRCPAHNCKLERLAALESGKERYNVKYNL